MHTLTIKPVSGGWLRITRGRTVIGYYRTMIEALDALDRVNGYPVK